MAQLVKNSPANVGDTRDMSLIPGSERSPGEGNDNAFQYPCLENSMARGAWRAIVHGVAKSQTQLSVCAHTRTRTHTHTHTQLLLTNSISLLERCKDHFVHNDNFLFLI